MFEEDWIPNDLGLVCKAMKEYYGWYAKSIIYSIVKKVL
jgi:hypothetical protein